VHLSYSWNFNPVHFSYLQYFRYCHLSCALSWSNLFLIPITMLRNVANPNSTPIGANSLVFPYLMHCKHNSRSSIQFQNRTIQEAQFSFKTACRQSYALNHSRWFSFKTAIFEECKQSYALISQFSIQCITISRSWVQEFKSSQPAIYSSIESFWCSFIPCCCGFMAHQHSMQTLLSYQMLIGGSPKSGTFLFVVSIFLDHCSTNFFGSFFRSFQSRWSCDKFGSYFNFVCSKKVFTKKIDILPFQVTLWLMKSPYQNSSWLRN